MSFGFSIGDFIAVGQLAQQLYRDIYLVARGAPEELQLLMTEVGTLSQSIQFLIDEVKDPNSALCCAGEARCEAVNKLVAEISKTLALMDELSKKHQLVSNSAGRSKLKRGWDKLKWANDASSVESLRSKLVRHNGMLSLLLTMVQSSSLERIETQNRRIETNIEGIQDLLGGSIQTPLISFGEGKVFQISLSQDLMREAEISRPWLTIGINDWVQTGRWWLLKAQNQLSAMPEDTHNIPLQAYVDLIKSSWILVDIISKHPQQKFFSSTSESLQVQLLAETLRRELQDVESRKLKLPSLDKIRRADLSIWIKSPAAVHLTPRDQVANHGNTSSWNTVDEQIYFQKFCLYQENINSPRVECLVLVLVDSSGKNSRVVVQTQKGFDILDMRLELKSFEDSTWEGKEASGLWEIVVNGRERQNMTFYFQNYEDSLLFGTVIESVWFYGYLNSTMDHDTLRGLILLTAVSTSNISVVKQAYNVQELSKVAVDAKEESDSQEICCRTISDLACAIAEVFLVNENNQTDTIFKEETTSSRISSLSQSRTVLLPDQRSIRLSDQNSRWVYEIFRITESYDKNSFAGILARMWDKAQFLQTTWFTAFFMAIASENISLVAALAEATPSLRVETCHMSGVDRLGFFGTALHFTASNGHAEIAQILLDNGFEADCKDDLNRTSLCLATWSCHYAVSKVLLNAKANANFRVQHLIHSESVSALEYICERSPEKQDLVALFLEHGADVTNAGSALCIASHLGHVETIRLLILHGADLTSENTDRANALGIAAHHGHKDIVQLLLDVGAPVDMDCKESGGNNFRSSTPLGLAAAVGREDIVKILLKRGAMVDTPAQTKNGRRFTPMQRAASNGQLETVRLLLDNRAGLHVDDGDHTPLHLAAAAKKNSVPIMELLLRHGAEVNAVDSLGNSPLHIAIRESKLESFKFLLDHGADITLGNAFQNTPLIIASERCVDPRILEILLMRGADLNARSQDGNTALHLAASSGQARSLEILLEHGADMTARNLRGETALLFAFSTTMDPGCLSVLLGNGADLNAKNKDGNRALHLAAMYGDAKTIEVLLGHGADIEALAAGRITPLYSAAMGKNKENVLKLIEHGADVMVQDDRQSTILWYTLTGGKEENLLEIFLKRGIDPSIPNERGMTIIDFARRMNYGRAEKMLEQYLAKIPQLPRTKTLAINTKAEEQSSAAVNALPVAEAKNQSEQPPSTGTLAIDTKAEEDPPAVVNTLPAAEEQKQIESRMERVLERLEGELRRVFVFNPSHGTQNFLDTFCFSVFFYNYESTTETTYSIMTKYI